MRQFASNSMQNQQDGFAVNVDVDVDVERQDKVDDVERQAKDAIDVLRDDGNQNRPRKQRIFGWSSRTPSIGVR